MSEKIFYFGYIVFFFCCEYKIKIFILFNSNVVFLNMKEGLIVILIVDKLFLNLRVININFKVGYF